MKWKRFIFLLLSFVLFLRKEWKKAQLGAPVSEAIVTLDRNLTSYTSEVESVPWYAYLPPYDMNPYTGIIIIGDVLLFVLPVACINETFLFVWNQLIQYEVHYEWEMRTTSPVWRDIHTVRLVLTSKIKPLTSVKIHDDCTLVISVWFHPRTFIRLARLYTSITRHRRYISSFLCEILDIIS